MVPCSGDRHAVDDRQIPPLEGVRGEQLAPARCASRDSAMASAPEVSRSSRCSTPAYPSRPCRCRAYSWARRSTVSSVAGLRVAGNRQQSGRLVDRRESPRPRRAAAGRGARAAVPAATRSKSMTAVGGTTARRDRGRSRRRPSTCPRSIALRMRVHDSSGSQHAETVDRACRRRHGADGGGTRRRVACSNAYASSISRGSLQAMPVKLTPYGRRPRVEAGRERRRRRVRDRAERHDHGRVARLGGDRGAARAGEEQRVERLRLHHLVDAVRGRRSSRSRARSAS